MFKLRQGCPCCVPCVKFIEFNGHDMWHVPYMSPVASPSIVLHENGKHLGVLVLLIAFLFPFHIQNTNLGIMYWILIDDLDITSMLKGKNAVWIFCCHKLSFVAGDNGEESGNITAVILDIYKAINWTTWKWTSANINGDCNEAFAW